MCVSGPLPCMCFINMHTHKALNVSEGSLAFIATVDLQGGTKKVVKTPGVALWQKSANKPGPLGGELSDSCHMLAGVQDS